MRVEIVGRYGTWRDVADAARTTVGKGNGEGEPSDSWKLKMVFAEHSPIRLLQFNAIFYDLPSWVSVHFVRHKIGIEHFVRSQRTDRTGIDRGKLPQDAHVDHRIVANAQSVINISRRRLCHCASQETRVAWRTFLYELKKIEPIITKACVQDCVYRGKCFEFKSCGFHKTERFKLCRKQYSDLWR